VPDLQPLITGLAPGEAPRWHAHRLRFSDRGAHAGVAGDLASTSEANVRVLAFPFSIAWFSDGQLLGAGAAGTLRSRHG
jgi:hypothetical protein